MLSFFYKWLFHVKKYQAAQARKSGRVKKKTLFKAFNRSAVDRETFGKYESKLFLYRRFKRILFIPAVCLTIWFLWVSYNAIGIFQ